MSPHRRLVYRTVWVKKRGRLVAFEFRSFVGNVGPHRYLIPAVGLIFLIKAIKAARNTCISKYRPSFVFCLTSWVRQKFPGSVGVGEHLGSGIEFPVHHPGPLARDA